jgi:hypothetical protein
MRFHHFFLFIIFLLFLALSLSFGFGCPPQSLAFGTRKFHEGHTFSCDVNFFFPRLLAITFFLGQKIRWKVTMYFHQTPSDHNVLPPDPERSGIKVELS